MPEAAAFVSPGRRVRDRRRARAPSSPPPRRTSEKPETAWIATQRGMRLGAALVSRHAASLDDTTMATIVGARGRVASLAPGVAPRARGGGGVWSRREGRARPSRAPYNALTTCPDPTTTRRESRVSRRWCASASSRTCLRYGRGSRDARGGSPRTDARAARGTRPSRGGRASERGAGRSRARGSRASRGVGFRRRARRRARAPDRTRRAAKSSTNEEPPTARGKSPPRVPVLGTTPRGVSEGACGEA